MTIYSYHLLIQSIITMTLKLFYKDYQSLVSKAIHLPSSFLPQKSYSAFPPLNVKTSWRASIALASPVVHLTQPLLTKNLEEVIQLAFCIATTSDIIEIQDRLYSPGLQNGQQRTPPNISPSFRCGH